MCIQLKHDLREGVTILASYTLYLHVQLTAYVYNAGLHYHTSPTTSQHQFIEPHPALSVTI